MSKGWEHDWQMLRFIERAQDQLNDALSELARKYGVRLSTPYFEENSGDVRRAIEKGAESD